MQNCGFPMAGLDAIREMHGPTAFVAVDRESDFGVARRMIYSSPQNKELGAELRDRKDTTVHVQLNPNIGRMGGDLGLRCVHEQSTGASAPRAAILRAKGSPSR